MNFFDNQGTLSTYSTSASLGTLGRETSDHQRRT